MAPIVATTMEPIIPYIDMPIKLNKNPPTKAPITPVTKSPHKPNPLPRETKPANHPEINPTIKNQSIFSHLLILEILLLYPFSHLNM
jgi:hypothetical protein